MKEAKHIEFGLNDDTKAGYTLIYNKPDIEEGAIKSIATLAVAGKVTKKPEVRLDEVTVCNFACIDFGGEYELDPKSKFSGGSFVSEIYYKDLLDIVGINANDEVDLTTITDKQKLEIIKKVMSSFWEAYKTHV